MGRDPAGNGEPVTAANAPVLASIEYTDTLLEPLLATNRNFPFESIAKEEGFEPAAARDEASVKAPLVESIVKREMSPPPSLATYTNFFDGCI